MTRKRKSRAPAEPLIETDADQVTIPIRHSGRAGHGTLVDPRASLPGGGAEPINVTPGHDAPRKHSKSATAKYYVYVRSLVRFHGDHVLALREAYPELADDEIMERQAELHHKLLAEADHGKPISQILADFDLTAPSVLSVIRDLMFSELPAAQLKSAEHVLSMLGDQSATETIEDLIRLSLANP